MHILSERKLIFMTKIYYLSTCDTCKRIIKELNLPEDTIMQDIKKEVITNEQVEEMKSLSGSYESLFSKRARLYKERGLKDMELSEDDYKSLILEHYTFLKRPVIIIDKQIFVGNSKKVTEATYKALHP
ncbi:glutaredoxin family protein, arsenate reductase [Zhouia amylolytica AD3]|uniref:Glutaredoxin family protein, arsenate reductase n=2 Tax=Zhouia amylolytica TaxID=376730 RepID=W2UKM7_9FLAO|nr:glutaredoxin family protein, arsenate reductase [Zhouia amylolytica AD3]